MVVASEALALQEGKMGSAALPRSAEPESEIQNSTPSIRPGGDRTIASRSLELFTPIHNPKPWKLTEVPFFQGLRVAITQIRTTLARLVSVSDIACRTTDARHRRVFMWVSIPASRSRSNPSPLAGLGRGTGLAIREDVLTLSSGEVGVSGGTRPTLNQNLFPGLFDDEDHVAMDPPWGLLLGPPRLRC
jgi:hypothetical protein